MQEETMINRRAVNSMGVAAAGALAFTFIASPAQSQTSTSQPAAAAPVKKKPPTSATPQMIDEAVQRSQARAAKATALGRPEQFGSEEPFTYVPGKTY
jgi:hypothetical protein